MSRQLSKGPQGFTLIELLVVISIIGLLVSIIFVSLSSARTKGQDAARISDVKALETAMELYANDHGGYPTSNGTNTGDVWLSDPTLIAELAPVYVPNMPQILQSDTDHYYAGGPTSGVSQQYGLYVYTAAGGWCKTGVSATNMATNGWWGSTTICNF